MATASVRKQPEVVHAEDSAAKPVDIGEQEQDPGSQLDLTATGNRQSDTSDSVTVESIVRGSTSIVQESNIGQFNRAPEG